MGRYRKVDSRIWNDQKFRELSRGAKLDFLFLMTHPHQTLLGAMRGTVSGLSQEMGIPIEMFEQEFGEIRCRNMAEVDPGASFIALPNFLKYNRPESPNVVKAWASALELVPECELKFQLIKRSAAFALDWPEAFQQALPEVFRKPFESLAVSLPVSLGEGLVKTSERLALSGTVLFSSSLDSPNTEVFPYVEKERERPETKSARTRIACGEEFHSVLLTPEQIEELKTKLGDRYDQLVKELDRYSQTHPKEFLKYKSHYAVLLNWFDRAVEEEDRRNGTRGNAKATGTARRGRPYVSKQRSQ